MESELHNLVCLPSLGYLQVIPERMSRKQETKTLVQEKNSEKDLAEMTH